MVTNASTGFSVRPHCGRCCPWIKPSSGCAPCSGRKASSVSTSLPNTWENLTDLAAQVVRRLSGIQVETSAVFNMATQFGGGKTHALTALYHLARLDLTKRHDPLQSLSSLEEMARRFPTGDKRRATENHHTATHLLQAALQDILGDHVHQAGSLVTPERLRFDFSHFARVTEEEIRQIEQMVNEKIFENIPVVIREMPREQALQSGAGIAGGGFRPDAPAAAGW